MARETIEVRSVDHGAVCVESSWWHPGCASLSLAALVVEANAQRPIPWQMPTTIGEVVRKLGRVRVTNAAHLADALISAESRAELNNALRAAGCRRFSRETLDIFRRLLWGQSA